MNRPMTDPGSHEAVRERISDRPDRICDPRATLPGTGERVPRGYSSVGNPTAATEATAAHRELSPDAPQGEAQRRPERTPAAAPFSHRRLARPRPRPDHLDPLSRVQMLDVPGRGRQVRVPELRLDHPQIDPLAGQFERVRVPQTVRMHPPLDPRLHRELLQQVAHI